MQLQMLRAPCSKRCNSFAPGGFLHRFSISWEVLFPLPFHGDLHVGSRKICYLHPMCGTEVMTGTAMSVAANIGCAWTWGWSAFAEPLEMTFERSTICDILCLSTTHSGNTGKGDGLQSVCACISASKRRVSWNLLSGAIHGGPVCLAICKNGFLLCLFQ